LSVLAWIAFVICAAAVALHYTTTGDTRFLLFAIPGLILLLIIPMTLAWMSRRSFSQADEQFGSKAKRCKIEKIDLGMVGNIVRVTGEVEKVSFKWLNRPHFHIRENTAGIRVIMFTAPSHNIRKGDTVEAVGIVMKHLLTRNKPIISAVSIKTIGV
jgi:hypothetical protein